MFDASSGKWSMSSEMKLPVSASALSSGVVDFASLSQETKQMLRGETKDVTAELSTIEEKDIEREWLHGEIVNEIYADADRDDFDVFQDMLL